MTASAKASASHLEEFGRLPEEGCCLKTRLLILALVMVGSVSDVGHAQPAPRSGSKNAVAKVGAGISGGIPGSKLSAVGGPVSGGAKINGTGMQHKR